MRHLVIFDGLDGGSWQQPRFSKAGKRGAGTVCAALGAAIEWLEPRVLFTRFAVIGDFTDGTPLHDVANVIKSYSPEFIATVGDNWYSDRSIDTSVGKSFHDYISPYAGSYGAGSPTGNRFWPTLGNHDYDNGVSNYLSYFTLPGNERYYSTRQGDVELFIINSNSQEPDGTSSTSKQGQWLKSALAASTAPWKLVLFHQPAYTSGTEGDHTYMQWPFQQWGASAVISGHDHIYERISKNGFPYFVDGLGGAEIVPAQRVESGSQVRYWDDYGAMMIDAGTATINFQFITRTGSIKDNYTLSKSPSPPPPPPPPGSSGTFIAAGSAWKYLDNGTNQATAWEAVSFNDTTWKSGNAQLGYGDGDEATVVSYGSDPNFKYVTTYFRKSFNVDDPSAVTALNLSLLRDDGAAVYLNGTEIYRNNLSSSAAYNTLATDAVEDNTWFASTINPSLLRSGSNVISVEIHQSDLNSSDISFDFSLAGTISTTGTPVVPAAPSSLEASAVSSTQINLTWTDNSTNETGFRVERSTDGTSFVEIATTGAASFNDSGRSAGQTYWYRVRAYNEVGNSSYSNIASATTPVVLTPPAAPGDLAAVGVSQSQINLTWADNSTNEANFVLERSPAGLNTWAQIAAPVAGATSYSDTSGLAAATSYDYRIRAVNAAGASADSAVATGATSQTGLPSPWVDGDVGTVGLAGSATFANGTFTVKGSGSDVWTTADGLHLVYQQMSGDVTIIARVASVQNTQQWAKAGVMVRESLAANSKEAAVHLTPVNGVVMTYRTSTGGASDGDFADGIPAPQWLKLVRSGNTFTSYRSNDGVGWTQVGTKSVSMASVIYVGLCVSAKNQAALNTSTFDNVSVNGAVISAPVIKSPAIEAPAMVFATIPLASEKDLADLFA